MVLPRARTRSTINDYNIIPGLRFRNAAVVLITGRNRDRIILVRNIRSRLWTTPGGIIDRTDRSPYFAAAREFREETTFTLPRSDRSLRRYNYNNNTIIYVIYSGRNFSGYRRTSETDALVYPKLNTVLNGGFEASYGRLRSSDKNSLLQMRRNGFI